jgi:hypothetical protein
VALLRSKAQGGGQCVLFDDGVDASAVAQHRYGSVCTLRGQASAPAEPPRRVTMK